MIFDESNRDLGRMFDDVTKYMSQEELADHHMCHPLGVATGAIERAIERGELRPLAR